MAHHHHPKSLNRRHFMGLTAASLGGLSLPMLMSASAQAQAADYKALVCIFLYGGNDGMNTVTPTDTARYDQYASVRGPVALPQASLVPLTGTNYGLHPSLKALGPVWAAGALAPVFNVGPLFAPLTQAEFLNESKTIPDSLFSHSDQQNHWETGTHQSITTTGWGGRAGQQTGATVLSVGGNGRFGLSAAGVPLVLPGPGGGFGLDNSTWSATPRAKREAAVTALHNDASAAMIQAAYAGQQNAAFGVSAALAPTLAITPGSAAAQQTAETLVINTAFGNLDDNSGTGGLNTDTGLARQLYQIAKLVAHRSRIPASVASNRHVYFATMGGFDTHDSQVITGDPGGGQHARLMAQLGDAMAAFHQALSSLGLGANVTTFTQSDFGRTFQPNSGNGTDHAWGNHHLIMGGGVQGGASYGQYPSLVLGGPDDAGINEWDSQGRWIPKVSVDQYAATLLKWWGLNDGQLSSVLPNLANFSVRDLGFMKTV